MKDERIRLKLAMIYMDLHDEIIERGWNSGKIEDETIEIENFNGLRNKELITWMNKNKNYVMLILHQLN